MSRPPVILITRPEKQAKRFAKMLRARFGQKVAIEISPLQQIEFTLPQVDLPQEAQFIFTSENGVKGFVKSGTPTRGTAWCVGPRTTKIAARHGFQAIDGGGTGQALIQHIKNHATPCGLHYIQGTTRRVDIARALAPLGYDVKNHVAYRQTPLSLSNEARRIVSGDQSCFLPLFSPQTAALLKKELSDVTKNALFIAISDATAKELGPQTDPIFTCPDPTADAVLDMIGALLMGKLPLAGYGGE